MHNLLEGVLLVSVILFFFLGNARGAFIVALTIPFSLLFASICLDLNKIPANLLSLGALDFGMVVDGSVVVIENIVRHFNLPSNAGKTPFERIREAVFEVLKPVFFARAIIITAYLPIFTLQSVEGRLFKPMAWTVSFALLGALIFSIVIAPGVGGNRVWEGSERMAQPTDGISTEQLSQHSAMGTKAQAHYFVGRWWGASRHFCSCCSAAWLDLNFCRTWMKVPFGCVERLRQARDRPKERE